MAKFPGVIDQIRIKGTSSSEQLLVTQALNYLNRRAFYGIGAEDVFADPSRSVVALPYNGSMPRNVTTIIDMAARAYAPAGVTKLVESLSGTSGGTAVITADGKVGVRATVEGIMRTDCTIRGSNGKASTGRITMAVAGGTDVDVLFLNPFNKFSAHHRPIGAGAQKGIPGTTGTPTRGRLAIVDHILCSAGPELTKYHNHVSATDPFFTITRRGTEGGGTGLPVTLRMPDNASLYPPSINPVDRTVTLYPRNGGTDDICDLFYRFGFPTKDAADHRVYGLAGVDWPGEDSGDGGTSASRLRYPSGVLTLTDVQAVSPLPIRHALQAVATRIGDPASSHILGKTYVWPAKGTDGNADDPGNNTGDMPYGVKLFVPPDLRSAVDALSLTPRQRAIAQCMIYYGMYLVDGTGPEGDGDGKIDVRVDGPLGKNGTIVTEINGAFAALKDFLWPMRNPRPLTSETEVWTDGLPYAGGGGPIDVNSVNTAYDAM